MPAVRPDRDRARAPSAAQRRLSVLLPVLGLAVLLAFTGAMLFAGFARIELTCERRVPGAPPGCRVREVRLLGLYDRRQSVPEVTGVGYRTLDVDTSSRVALASTVVLRGSAGPVALSKVASNLGSRWKADALLRLRAFLAAPNEHSLSLVIEERNLFGWIGAGIGALLLSSVALWGARGLRVRAGRRR